MPRSFLPLVPVLVGYLAANTTTAQMVICPGNPVQFELDQSYYGVKTWEYSPDSISWSPVDIVEQEPFILQPEQAGYYRVNFHNQDCDTTYTSNTIQFRFPAPVHLLTLFEDHHVAESVNPVFWLDRYAELTNISYVLNGVEYASTLQFEMLPNPGIPFEIYANALDASGCAIHSDTLHFTVFNSDMAGTGTLQTTAAITGNDIVVTSSIDTVSFESGQPFDIQY